MKKKDPTSNIRITGARTHNLRNIDVNIPRDALVVITGLSGSGKSSLAFDTIYAEGQRRYVESLSAYARQFLGRMDKPDVDQITGLSPAISIEQKNTSHNPRSTVGTITEIQDYLRLLFARAGTPRCPVHHEPLEAKTISQMADYILGKEQKQRILLLAPIISNRKGEHTQAINHLKQQGFLRARIDGDVYELDNPPQLDEKKKHTVEVIVDRFRVRDDIGVRLAESLEVALRLGDGLVLVVSPDDDDEFPLSARYACPYCGYSISEMEPRMFSFNSRIGACSRCEGLGTVIEFDKNKLIPDTTMSLSAGAIRGWGKANVMRHKIVRALADHYQFDLNAPYRSLSDEHKHVLLYGSGKQQVPLPLPHSRRKTKRIFSGIIAHLQRRYHETESPYLQKEFTDYMSQQPCSECGGTRLNEAARHVFIDSHNLPAVTALPISETINFFEQLKLGRQKSKIAASIVKEISQRLKFLNDVGLGYLSLERNAETLSGGEAQRIRLASQIGAGLVGVIYILDEPSIGLHQRDNARLLNTLTRLRDIGNSVIVVEHDESTIRTADQVIDIGPGAGRFGGRVVAQGTAAQISKVADSATGRYLSGIERIDLPATRQTKRKKFIRLKGLTGNNLKNINVEIPLGIFTCVTGVSGSGKSTLINETLYKYIARKLHHNTVTPAPCKSISGIQHIDRVMDINQSPIGRTPRSNPATYTELFTHIRKLFAATPEARARAYQSGRFSFNVPGGRCEACQGHGVIRVEMHFLSDVYITCEVCQGKKYNRETLDILYKGKNIADVLNLDVVSALEFFSAIPAAKRILTTLMDVGLSYIRLGQNAVTLSGGEAQRIKLARELSKRDTGNTLYILDEPTTGLHFADTKQLLAVLSRLRDAGNTIVVIEHNLDVIKTADWVIDLGPEGGDSGGEVVACGTPEELTQVKESYTGRFLKSVL